MRKKIKDYIDSSVDRLTGRLACEVESNHKWIDMLRKRSETCTPPRDCYLTQLVASSYIGKVVTLDDNGTKIIGVCTGINDLDATRPIFEIDGVLRSGVPVDAKEVPHE